MKLLNLSIFFMVFTNFCMEVEKVEWKKISTCEDIEKFVSTIIAYPAYDLEDLIQLKSNPNSFVSYAGVVSQGKLLSKKNKKFGFIMLPLIKKRESTAAFVSMNIRKHKGDLYIRSITSDELLELKNKFYSKEIEFDDYTFVLLNAKKYDKSVLTWSNKKANL